MRGEPSLTARYALASNAMVEATVNPDFSQVESDAAQIDVNSNFALFYPEKRPFFQEGADLFDTWLEAVYTRSINDPSIAGKLTGRSGGTSFAVLSARDMHSPIILPFEEFSAFLSNGRSVSNVVRVKQEVGEQTHVGLVATDRRYDDGGSGSLAGLDGRLRLNGQLSLEAQYLLTFTEEPEDTNLTRGLNRVTFDDGRHTAAFDGERYRGHALYAGLARDGRSWALNLRYYDRSPTFRAENGFEVRNAYRQGYGSTSCIVRFDDSDTWDYLSPGAQVSRSWNYDDVVKDESAQVWLSGRLRRAQLTWHVQHKVDAERFGGRDYRGLWQAHLCGSARPSDLLALQRRGQLRPPGLLRRGGRRPAGGLQPVLRPQARGPGAAGDERRLVAQPPPGHGHEALRRLGDAHAPGPAADPRTVGAPGAPVRRPTATVGGRPAAAVPDRPVHHLLRGLDPGLPAAVGVGRPGRANNGA